jgi:hypothetical protein
MHKFARYSVLAVVVIFAMIAPSLVVAQNLGNGQVAFGQAVKGQNAAQVEGGILNVVNWVANVICPVVSGLFVVATVIQWRAGRGWLPTAATAGGLLCVSGILRLIEFFITNGQAIQ